MKPEERDDVLIAIYIQLSRIYDILLLGPEADRKAIAEAHKNGQLIGPEPVMSSDEE